MQKSYIDRISGNLKRFVWKDEKRANFRCPYCGDSAKNEFKCRGWLIDNGDGFYYYCHNCQHSLHFYGFLTDIDSSLAKQYNYEKFKRRREVEHIMTPKPKKLVNTAPFITQNILDGVELVTNLTQQHVARKYLDSRLLPIKGLYYTPDINLITSKLEKYKATKFIKDSCIIIPFYSEDKRLIYFQVRYINNVGIRYITFEIDKSHTKIFGIDKIDKSKPVYVLEGSFDSLFIDNSVAMAGADIDQTFFTKNGIDPVFVFDNEPRNIAILKKIKKVIDANYKVVIWDKTFNRGVKDINEIIKSGYSREWINQYLIGHTYQTLLAKLKFSSYKHNI